MIWLREEELKLWVSCPRPNDLKGRERRAEQTKQMHR